MLCNSILASMFLVSPALLTKETGQDAWMIVLIAGVFGVLYGYFVMSVGFRHPDKNLVEHSINILGPWLGRVVAIIYALFFLHLSACLILSFGSLLITETMPETPLAVLNVLLVLIAAYGAYLGLEVFTRVNEIIFPLSLVVLMAIFAIGIPDMNFELLKPFFTHTPSQMMRASMVLFALYAEGTFVLMIIPSLPKSNMTWQIAFPVALILSFMMLADVGALIAMFGHEDVERMVFPTYEFAKVVRLGGFLERIESLLVGVWVGTVGLKVTAFYYVSALALAQALNLRDYRPLILPYAFILMVLSLIGWSDTNEITRYLINYFPLFALTVLGGTPILLYLAGIIRKRDSTGGDKKDEEKISET